jgi:hypothetical protein
VMTLDTNGLVRHMRLFYLPTPATAQACHVSKLLPDPASAGQNVVLGSEALDSA